MKEKHNEKGSVMIVLVAMIAIIGTVMGAGIVFMNSGNRRAWSTARSNQALYLAEAGIEKAIPYLKSHWDSPSPIPSTSIFPISTSTPTPSPIGSYNVTFIKPTPSPSPDCWVISSTGTTNSGKSETVSIELTKQIAGGTTLNLDLALFTYNSINMGKKGSSQIIGDVGINSTASKSIYFPWSAIINGHLYVGPGGIPSQVVSGAQSSPWINNVTLGTTNLAVLRTYPTPVFPGYPTDLPTRSSLTLQGSTNGTISADGYYPNITIQNNTILTIDVPTGTERRIMVDTLNMPQGNIVLNGTGKLTLYVKNTFTYTNGSKINYGVSGNGDPNQVMIYYKGTNDFSTAGDTKINGTVFVNTANMVINNSGAIKGNIITGGNNVSISGAGEAGEAMVRVFYAPNANVSLTGSGTIIGAVIAKIFNASGDSRIYYESSNSTIIIPTGEGTSNEFIISDWRSSGF
ncbi:MAG: hypothetical protein NTY95_14730 [Bacteroidia bacterium]|nr:hypothetical protein [Bacteroidia bacterium]